MFERDRPAGRHGFLTAHGDKFVFEDGTEARFWGVWFDSAASFPPHHYSEIVAKRLAKFGVNIVRTHQMDGEWATPNIFEFNRANPSPDTRSFDPESLDRLDYLFYCLKQEGVYIYLDLMTYRKFRAGDGVDAVDQLPGGHNPYCYFDPRLIELQKEFARDLFTHINPYTGLAYRDDPAIVLTELQNECQLFTHFLRPVLEPYRTRLEGMYRQWAGENGLVVAEGKVDFTPEDGQIGRFFLDLHVDHYREMIDCLRSIGVKIPITGTTCPDELGTLACNRETDYLDGHNYWNFPRWEFPPEGTDIRPMVGEAETTFDRLSFMRTLDKPYFVSEWDHAWPAPYRAESPVWYAAVGALQGWGGFTIHTYRYGTHHPQDWMGATSINGSPYRKHFDTFNDPAKFGLFYHAALLFRRADVRESDASVAIQTTEDLPFWPYRTSVDVPALTLLPEKHRVGVVVPGAPADADEVVSPDKVAVDTGQGEVRSDTGELWRSWEKRIGWIDSPRTTAAYGFLGEAGTISISGLELEVETDFATIAISSLTDDPISESDALLLTAVGRADNSGAEHNEEGTVTLDQGHAPVIIEPIEAKIKLETARPNLKVWVIADNKEAVTPLETEYEEGVLTFNIGPQPFYNRSSIYHIIRI